VAKVAEHKPNTSDLGSTTNTHLKCSVMVFRKLSSPGVLSVSLLCLF
jgi:hypothetical protein